MKSVRMRFRIAELLKHDLSSIQIPKLESSDWQCSLVVSFSNTTVVEDVEIYGLAIVVDYGGEGAPAENLLHAVWWCVVGSASELDEPVWFGASAERFD